MTTMDSAPIVNILIATFAGLGLPRTLSLPTPATASISTLYATILSRLPAADPRLLITTVSNKQLSPTSCQPISTLLSTPDDTLLSLRLSRKLCGGKGGFGSQLRAAGGRMSSRKKNNANATGSNRNLDGRRLRTVDEAKRLAEYLAMKPEMERKEREERKKRLEEVVESAERREEMIRRGGDGGVRLDADFVEGKEAAEAKTRDAVEKAMREGMLARTGSETEDEDMQEGDSEGSSGDAKAEASSSSGRFFGWDEEDSSDEDEEEEEEHVVLEATAPAYVGKGKGKAAE